MTIKNFLKPTKKKIILFILLIIIIPIILSIISVLVIYPLSNYTICLHCTLVSGNPEYMLKISLHNIIQTLFYPIILVYTAGIYLGGPGFNLIAVLQEAFRLLIIQIPVFYLLSCTIIKILKKIN
jgi:hypothetical protein